MITSADIGEKLSTQPFEPFRIVTSSGESYDVTHPEVVFLSKRVAYVGVAKDPRLKIYDPVHVVSILHITALEPLPSAGSRKRR
jgi:hypothetical protein